MTSQALIRSSMEEFAQLSTSQSSALVQIFLNAAVACIAHTRELIPWTSTCFQTRYVNGIQLDAGRAHDLYRDFCDRMTTKSGESQEFRILQRGKDERADHVLDMIEGGAIDALDQNFLHAMQILIAADPADPASALETYVFLFNYEHGKVSQVAVSPSTTTPFTLQDGHRSFSASIRTLLKSLKNLPRLPRRRSLGVSLLYNDDCPTDYQPTGFVDVRRYTVMPLRGCWTDLWQKLPTPVTEFITGNLRISVGGKSLQLIENTSCSRLQDRKLSVHLQNMQKTSSHDPGVTPTATSLLRDHSPQPAVSVEREDSAHTRSQVSGKNAKGSSRSLNQDPNDQAQSTKRTCHPAVDTDNLIVTANSLTKLTVTSKNRRRRNVAVSKLAELLVQARAMENNCSVSNNLFDMGQLRDGRIKRLERTGPVRCECGGCHEDEHMLLCELCGTRQHKACYGYNALRQGCCPEDHFCYDCLLLPREAATSRNMTGIVHMRLALLFLVKKPSSEVEIGPDFLQSVFPGSDSMADLQQIINRLAGEGYLKQRSNGHASILQTANREEAQATYLEPLAGIVHHYQIVRDGDTAEKRKTAALKALKSYTKDRPFSFNDESNSEYDQIHVKNSAGREMIRWGFYSGWKRKRSTESPDTGTGLRRKISLSAAFVEIDRSTPSEIMSMDEAMLEVVDEAEWTLRLESSLVSGDTDFD